MENRSNVKIDPDSCCVRIQTKTFTYSVNPIEFQQSVALIILTENLRVVLVLVKPTDNSFELIHFFSLERK